MKQSEQDSRKVNRRDALKGLAGFAATPLFANQLRANKGSVASMSPRLLKSRLFRLVCGSSLSIRGGAFSVEMSPARKTRVSTTPSGGEWISPTTGASKISFQPPTRRARAQFGLVATPRPGLVPSIWL